MIINKINPVKCINFNSFQENKNFKNISFGEKRLGDNVLYNPSEETDIKITPISESLLKKAYLLEKSGIKSILQYMSFSLRNIDEIRSLYGAKDVLNAKNVMMFGLDSLTFASQDFINVVNNKFGKSNSYKVLSLDKIISMYKKLR